MIKEFNYYIAEGEVKKESVNLAKAQLLMNRAKNRLKYIEKQEIDGETAPFIFEDIYEYIREAAQALMTLGDYKPLSHVALISYLKEFHEFPERYIETFDMYRKNRNNVVYGVANVIAEECEETLVFLKEFLAKISEEFDKSK